MSHLEQTIAVLAQDAKPVKAASGPLRSLVEWCAVTLAVMALYLATVPLRPDMAAEIHSTLFVAEVISLTGMVLSTAMAAVYLCFPDMLQKPGMAYLPVLPLASFIGLSIYRAGHQDLFALPLSEAAYGDVDCVGCILAISVLPGLWMFRLIRQHATVRPMLAGAFALMASACIGMVLLKFVEQNDSVTHMLLSHVFPVVMLTATGGWLGRNYLRW